MCTLSQEEHVRADLECGSLEVNVRRGARVLGPDRDQPAFSGTSQQPKTERLKEAQVWWKTQAQLLGPTAQSQQQEASPKGGQMGGESRVLEKPGKPFCRRWTEAG